MSDKAPKPIPFNDLASSIHQYFWYRRKVSEWTKGPIEYEFTRRRVVLAKQGLPEKEVWFLVRRTLDKDPKYSYYIGKNGWKTWTVLKYRCKVNWFGR